MVENSSLYNSIQFLQNFGFFDVILPFLLVFTVVFGILEKTRIFGTEKVGGKDVPRKNINSMIAFTIAFFVIAATQVVNVMQVALPYIMLVLVFIIAFLILFGATMSGKEEMNLWENSPKLRGVFVFGIFVAMIAIILGAFGMLQDLINLIYGGMRGTVVSSVVLLAVVLGSIWFVMHGSGKGE